VRWKINGRNNKYIYILVGKRLLGRTMPPVHLSTLLKRK
jgi:hypothetical protein